MAKERFYLIFSDQPNKRLQINEPINYSEVDFQLDQRENGMGRDVSLSGGTVNFKFTLYRHGKAFDKLLYFAHYFGFESDVKLIIVLENGTEFIGELDFVLAQTNDFNYFECPVIIESQMQIFRRRSETKVDMFSNIDINGDVINPLVPQNLLIQAKPSIQLSEWNQAAPSTLDMTHLGEFINITNTIIQSGIENTLTPFENITTFTGKGFKILEAQSNLNNVILKLSNINISVNGGEIKSLRIYIFKGAEYPVAVKPLDQMTILYDKKVLSGSANILGDLPDYNIGNIARSEGVWLFLRITQVLAYQLTVNINSINVKISSESVAYNSITPTFRLIDVMKQIAKSTSGLEVYAPRYDYGGEFYDTVLTSGKLLGGNITDPFYVSWDDLEKSFRPEVNADSEIQLDKRVFVGIEKDFYTSEECGFFNRTQFSQMVRKPNLLYCINNFNYKYESYQSLKENTEPNSESTIHGQSIFTPFNQRVENSRELSVKWIRDAILLDVQQRLSTKVSKDTATQDDDKIFAIDTIATESDQQFTESTTLQHTFSTSYLSLRSNGDVNFIVLGIKADTTFIISYPDLNAGDYRVLLITNTELQLERISGGSITSANDGVRLTKYTYEIKQETIPLTNRANQGFDYVLNLISPDRYSNLRYSVQRNIKKYWNSYLATVNIYHKDKKLKNTYYKNNGKCETKFAGLAIIEKEDWIPTDPIVTPYMYENVIFANVDFSEFIALQNMIRTKRGFIRTIDNNNRVLKLYPIKMSYENKTRQLTMSGQEKFEKTYMTIIKTGGIITINNETRLRKLTYDVTVLDRDKQVVLFDLERQRLYNGVYWDKVSVNGVTYETIELLKNALDLL